MSLDVTRIHVGAARIWTGVTVAATGAPPTYVVHTNGVPGTGTEIGLTEGDCTFTYTSKATEIMAEQSLAPVDVYTEAESAELTFSCQEANANAIKMAMNPSIGYDSTGGDGFYFGNGTAVLSPTLTGVFFSAPRRDNPAKYIVGMLYKVYSKDPFTFPMARAKKATYKITFVGLADLSRTAKDQVGYFRRET